MVWVTGLLYNNICKRNAADAKQKKKTWRGTSRNPKDIPKITQWDLIIQSIIPWQTHTVYIYIHNIIYIYCIIIAFIYIYHYIMSCPKILYPKIQSSSKKNPRNLHLDSGQYRPTGEPNSPRSQILAGDRLEKNKKKWIGLREHLKRKPQI